MAKSVAWVFVVYQPVGFHLISFPAFSCFGLRCGVVSRFASVFIQRDILDSLGLIPTRALAPYARGASTTKPSYTMPITVWLEEGLEEVAGSRLGLRVR